MAVMIGYTSFGKRQHISFLRFECLEIGCNQAFLLISDGPASLLSCGWFAHKPLLERTGRAFVGTSVDDLCAQARQRMSERDLSGAMALFEEAIQNDPAHIAAHEGLATICFVKKDHARAVELFKRVVALDPKRIDPLVNLGAAQNRDGKFNDAIKTLRQAVTRDRHCAAAFYNLGFAQRNAKQPSMAVSAFKEAIRLEPTMWEAYVNLGFTLLDMKNPTQAALNFERAIQLRPESERARQGLLTARQQIDQGRKAISPFGRLVNMEEVTRQNAMDARQQRKLTAEERLDDRVQAHRISRDLEQCTVVFFNQLKDELSPAVLHLSRLANEPESRGWGQGMEAFQTATERFRHLIQIINSKFAELQQHEDNIQQQCLAPQPKQ